MTIDSVEIAGYRHETLHTGVLKYLLEQPGVGEEAAPERRLPSQTGLAGRQLRRSLDR